MSGDRYFIRDQNAIYFLTHTVVRWLDVFTRMNHKTVGCLMTSHLHLIASAREGYKLSNILRDMKEHIAKEVIRLIEEEPESRRENFLEIFKEEGKKDRRISKYKFWQESNHAIELDPMRPDIIDQKLNYIHYNPVEEGIVQYPEEYLFSSARDYAEIKGLVKIEIM
jgi:putative transposase